VRLQLTFLLLLLTGFPLVANRIATYFSLVKIRVATYFFLDVSGVAMDFSSVATYFLIVSGVATDISSVAATVIISFFWVVSHYRKKVICRRPIPKPTAR
jgi:hypothetical protein